MLPPGPRTPALWQTVDYMQNPGRVLARHRARYGDAFRIRSLNVDGVVITTAALAKEAFAKDPDGYDAFAAPLEGIFGPSSIFATSGATHRRQRKLLNPRFHGAELRRFLEVMRDVAARHLGAVPEGKAVAMLDVGQDISLDVIVETVFGAGSVDRDRARRVMRAMLDGFAPAVLFSKHVRTPLFPPWKRFVAAREDFYALARETIGARRAGKSAGDDILGMLVAARFDDGSAMGDEEIETHLLTLLVAGHETTAIALAWGAYFLAKEPEILAKLRAELRGVTSPEVLVKLPFLGAVCDETLRVRPVVPDVVRPVREATDIGGWRVPAGEAIIVALQSILTDPAVFPEPDRFRPERFLERKFSAAEFSPFGGGHRRCLGAAFAEMELRVVLGTLAAGWDTELVDPDPEPTVRRNVTMAPGRGVRVRLKRRG